MKLWTMILVLCLSGCYLANGSPSEDKYWERIYKKENQDIDCHKKIYLMLDKKDKEIFDRGRYDWDGVYKNKELYTLYKKILDEFYQNRNKCLYDSGYRFRPPLYWCLAQDGDNTKICIENMKYRN